MKRVELESVTRIFESDFVALDGINLAFSQGEIHTILGENGAGKSTLVHILSGLIEPTSGTLKIDGTAARFASSADALSLGIAMVHQRPLLCDDLDVLENIMLGTKGLRLDRSNRRKKIAHIADDWNITIDLSAPARSLSPRNRLYAALLAALYRDPSFLILDEPTAILDPDERDRFMETLVRAKKGGLGIIVITHKLHDAVRWSDRVTILRHGKLVFSGQKTGAVTEESLAAFFSAAPAVRPTAPPAAQQAVPAASPVAAPDIPPQKNASGGVSFSVSNLSVTLPNRAPIHNVSFRAEQGTVTGIFGLPGSGIDVLEDLLSGMIRPDGGTMAFEYASKAALTLAAPQIAPDKLRKAGAGFVPANRTFRGSNPSLSVRDLLAAYQTGSKKETDRFSQLILEEEHINVEPERLARTLSGGQLQRLILARELARHPGVLILAEPEWGLDIGSTERFRARLDAAAKTGMTIVVLTDSPDAMKKHELYHRIYSLDEGRLK